MVNYALLYKQSLYLKTLWKRDSQGTAHLKIKTVIALWKKDRRSKPLHVVDSASMSEDSAFAGELQELSVLPTVVQPITLDEQ